MKKALLVTHVSGFVPQFEMNNVRILQEMGYEIHYASNYRNPSYGKDNRRLEGTGIIRHQIDFMRNPYSRKNLTAYHQLKQLMKEEHFEVVHCHNPLSSVLARLAAHATDTGPVIYTAHGFHFFKGAPIWNWMLYYIMEYLLSYYTDWLICINQEDFRRAKNHFHAERVAYIPGVGIDIQKIAEAAVQKEVKRAELGIPPDAKVILSVGEFIKRKNHETAIRALAGEADENMVYVICGHGALEEYLKTLVKELHLESRVFFPGYRTDIYEICKASDVFVFPSFQEGLPVALLEALAAGLPVVCSDIRGNHDLVDDAGGFLAAPTDVDAFRRAINQLCSDEALRISMGTYNAKRAEQYSWQLVSKTMRNIYEDLLKHGKED